MLTFPRGGKYMNKDMNYVYAVYQEKSFSKAAKKLYISQPALSTSVKKVEENLNVMIFDRGTNPISLTPAGKFYIKSVEKIMEIENEMQTYFSTISKERKSVINIGAPAFFCAHILPTIVHEFKELEPDCNVNLLETNTEELSNCLDNGVVDIGLGVEPLDDNRYDKEIWHQENIILAVPAHYEINTKLEKYVLSFEEIRSNEYLSEKRLSIEMEWFKNEPFILLKKGNDLHKRAINMCNSRGFKPEVIMYMDQLLTSYYVAYSGKGISFVRADITNYIEPTEKLVFYKINDKKSTRDILLHCKKSNALSGASKAFFEFIKNYDN